MHEHACDDVGYRLNLSPRGSYSPGEHTTSQGEHVMPVAVDRTSPTKPGNFRVTGKTQTTVTVAWNASTDNSGSVTYNVRMWQEGRYVTVATAPQGQTTYTKTGLIPNVQYFFHVEAVGPSGNKAISDGAYTTTDPDRTPPPAPANLRVTRVTASLTLDDCL
jgi:chitinase